MAIFGAGSNWEGKEIKEDFFNNENYVIGWDISDGEDLYNQISSIKVGDIIYLKANKPGSLDLRVKGIGIVKKSLVNQLFDKRENLSINRRNFELPVRWIVKNEFHISIPSNTGKLTNVRAATLYEEFLPFVQVEILDKLFNEIK
ncbi:hypothetical protein [Psychroflexus tropicus]|uniref:hypothetical protein n=1 Tax=Psychroflexus tropicus TaxID=197345 RepID=UPI0003601772|nr:hypothetical protein [Psychroflexus tropicus]